MKNLERYFFYFCFCATVSVSTPTRVSADPAAVNFDKALEEMVAHSFERDRAKANTALTRAQGVQASEIWSPKVNLVGKETRSKIEDVKGSTRSVGINSNLNLYRFGADRLAQSAAKLDEEAARENENKVRLDVQFKSARLLLKYLRLQLEQDVVKDSVALREKSLSIANSRFRSGLIPNQEVQKVEIDFELAKGNLASNETAMHEALLDIAVARQLPPESASIQLEHKWPWQPKIESLITSATKEPSYVDVLNIRPDYVANQNQLKASSMRIDEARRRSLPSLDFTLGYDINRDNNEPVIARGWNGALILSVPLFDAGAMRSAVEAGIATEKTLEIEASSIRTELPSSLTSTKQAMSESFTTAQSREKILSISERLHETTLLRFQKGLISANELNEDYRRLLDTKLAAIDAWANAHEKMVAFCQARARDLGSCR